MLKPAALNAYSPPASPGGGGGSHAHMYHEMAKGPDKEKVLQLAFRNNNCAFDKFVSIVKFYG